MRIVSFIRRILLTDFGIALLITLAWKVVLLAIGFAIDSYYGNASSFLDHTMRWDAGWYLTIINGHYTDNLASSAFYPLFPLLVYTVHFISFGMIDYSLAGQLVNTIAVWLALTAAIKLGRILLGERHRYWIIGLMLTAPAAFFMHVFYGEAVFIALSFWAYYFALKRKWLAVGLLLGALTATRLPAILIVALCVLEYMRAYSWNLKRILNRNILFFLIAPAGFLLFSLYLLTVQGDAIGMFHAYKATDDWIYQVFNPNIIDTFARSIYQIVRVIGGLRPLDNVFAVNILIPTLSLITLGLSSLYLIVKHRQKMLPLGVVGILSAIMFTLNSNVVSVHRYVLPCLAVYVACALLFAAPKKRIYLYVICALGVVVQILLYSLFVRGIFAG